MGWVSGCLVDRGRSGVIYGLRRSLGGRPVGSHPSSNKLERGFHSGVCQRQHARGGRGFPWWPSPASRVMVSTSCLLPPQERLRDQQMGLTQDFFKWLLLHWVLECVEFCVCPLFPTALVLLEAPLAFTADVRGLVFPEQGLWAGEPVRGSGPCSLGSSSAVVN